MNIALLRKLLPEWAWRAKHCGMSFVYIGNKGEDYVEVREAKIQYGTVWVASIKGVDTNFGDWLRKLNAEAKAADGWNTRTATDEEKRLRRTVATLRARLNYQIKLPAAIRHFAFEPLKPYGFGLTRSQMRKVHADKVTAIRAIGRLP